MAKEGSAEATIRDIKRKTRRKYSARRTVLCDPDALAGDPTRIPVDDMTGTAAYLDQHTQEFTAYHNSARPHQGFDWHIPVPQTAPVGCGLVRRRNIWLLS